MSMINLLPDDYFQRRSEQRTRSMCVVLFAIVMFGIGTAILITERNVKNTEKVLDQININYAEAANKLSRLQQLKAQQRQHISKARATASLIERVPRSYILATITQALPSHAALTEVKLIPKRHTVGTKVQPKKGSKFQAVKGKKAPEPIQEVRTTVEVSGVAATDVDVGTFIANLLPCELFSGVDLDYSEEKELTKSSSDAPAETVRKFKVVMQLKTGLDVMELSAVEPTTVSLLPPIDEDHAPAHGAGLTLSHGGTTR